MKRLLVLAALAAFSVYAADIPISGLPAASSVAGADIVPIVQGGVTKKATFTQVLNNNAATATALAANPADCAANRYATTIAANGDLTCAQVSMTAGITGTTPVANGGTGITSLATGMATWWGASTSANLAAALTDETGTGAAVFANTPALVTPDIGAATGTSLVLSGNVTAANLLVQGTLVDTNLCSYASSGTFINCNTASSGTGNVVRVTSATLVTPTLGAATATSINGLALTSSTGTLTITNAKTLAATNTLTLSGTDSTVMTFPTTSATIARTDAANTFTGTQTVGALVATTVNGNTFTTGTGVLTIAAGKTLTQSNTLTFTGTDSSSVAFGTGGTVTYKIASGTSALGTSAISSATCATVVTTSATGTATTDVINWGFNGDPTAVTGYTASASGMLTIIAYPSANNVNYKVCNNTSGSITPGAITLNWNVVR